MSLMGAAGRGAERWAADLRGLFPSHGLNLSPSSESADPQTGV